MMLFNANCINGWLEDFFFRVSFCLDNKKLWRKERLATKEKTQTLCLLIRVKHARRLSFHFAKHVMQFVYCYYYRKLHTASSNTKLMTISLHHVHEIFMFSFSLFSHISSFVFEKCTANFSFTLLCVFSVVCLTNEQNNFSKKCRSIWRNCKLYSGSCKQFWTISVIVKLLRCLSDIYNQLPAVLAVQSLHITSKDSKTVVLELCDTAR